MSLRLSRIYPSKTVSVGAALYKSLEPPCYEPQLQPVYYHFEHKFLRQVWPSFHKIHRFRLKTIQCCLQSSVKYPRTWPFPEIIRSSTQALVPEEPNRHERIGNIFEVGTGWGLTRVNPFDGWRITETGHTNFHAVLISRCSRHIVVNQHHVIDL